MTDRKRGERPNSAMLIPEAIPRWFGKFFDAAKREEKYENTVPSPAIKKKTARSMSLSPLYSDQAATICTSVPHNTSFHQVFT